MKTAITPVYHVRYKAPALAAILTGIVTLGIGIATLTQAQEPARTVATGSGIPLSADAPDSYTVKHGDTLWDIAKVFLRDPWFWPEIWYVNKQIQNPHLIYPGDTLRLVYIDGRPRVTLQRGTMERGDSARVLPRVRSEPLESAVTTIPYATV